MNTTTKPKQAYSSETAKYRHLTKHYCIGNGIEIGSGGDPVVPYAIQFELPESEYARYNSNQPARGPIQYRSANALFDLPFKDSTIDWVYSSHVIEDFGREDWKRMFAEWRRVLRRNGKLILLVPEVERWNYAIRVLGQPPNCSHFAPEPHVGEISKYAVPLGFRTIRDSLTDCFQHDYSILYVGQLVK